MRFCKTEDTLKGCLQVLPGNRTKIVSGGIKENFGRKTRMKVNMGINES
jgi:hypothetical protein